MRHLFAALTVMSICTISLAKPLLADQHQPPPAAPAQSAFAVHGAIGLYWRETWQEAGGTPKWLELQPVIAGDVYLGSRSYAKGWTMGGELEVSVRRIDDYRALKFGIRREF